MRRIETSLFFMLLACSSSVFAAEFTMTTYYPSPSGNYARLKLMPTDAPSGTCQTGTMFVDTSGQFKYCFPGALFPASNDGVWGGLSPWRQDGAYNIYLSDETNYENLKVGVGTKTPGAPLDVKGEMRVSNSTSSYVGFKAPADAETVTYTLPPKDGTTGQVLTTDGTGKITWQASAGGDGVTFF